MRNILFYHANGILKDNKIFDFYWGSNMCFLGTASLYLKTHIELNRPILAKQLNWLVPIQERLSDEQLISIIEQKQVDILCTSHYIWNHSFLIDQLNRVKKTIKKNVKIVSGGPSINVNLDKDFFKNHGFIDYAVYGPGEVAFTDILTSMLEDKTLIKFNTSNCAWNNQNKEMVVADYKYVPQLAVSPFCFNEDYFSAIVNKEIDRGNEVILSYEVTRGCPYKCTFCDWNSGLSNKVTRRKHTYKDEIDLFHRLKIKQIILSDANVGQYQEDIDMIEYFAHKNTAEDAGFKLDPNFSKLKKDNVLKIYHAMCRANLVNGGLVFSIQDNNLQVLTNIDRPSVDWETHCSMIREIKTTYPDTKLIAQLIQGLPGQTVASWRETLRSVSNENIILDIMINELLPASPAATNPEYQQNFKFVYSKSKRFAKSGVFYGQFPESCISFTQQDFVEMTLLSCIYASLTYLKFDLKFHIEFDVNVMADKFLASNEYTLLKENLTKNWLTRDEFFFTKGFGNTNEVVPACNIGASRKQWVKNSKFLTFLYQNSDIFNDKIKFLKFVNYLKKKHDEEKYMLKIDNYDNTIN